MPYALSACRHLPCLVTISLAVAGCQPRTAESGALDSLPLWTLSADPMVELVDDGTPERQFTRTLSARLPNGDLLVADAGSKELRVFRGGARVARLGGEGDGPGELRDIHRLGLVGDTIVVIALPMVSRDVNLLTVAGGFVARLRLRPPAGTPGVVPLGRLSTGEFLVEEGRGFSVMAREPPIGQLMPDSVSWGILRQAPDDSIGTYQPLGRFRRHFMVAFRTAGTPVPFSMTQFTLGPTAQWAISGDQVWVADGADGTLTAFDGQGRVVAQVQLAGSGEASTEATMRQARARAVAAAATPGAQAQVEAVFDPALRPTTLPVLDALVGGPDGEVWVRRYRLDPAAPQVFVVVDRQGQMTASVEVPADVMVHQVGTDFVLGVKRDADGVETVVVHRLDRGR